MRIELKHFCDILRIEVVFIHLFSLFIRCVYKEYEHRNIDLITPDIQIELATNNNS